MVVKAQRPVGFGSISNGLFGVACYSHKCGIQIKTAPPPKLSIRGVRALTDVILHPHFNFRVLLNSYRSTLAPACYPAR